MSGFYITPAGVLEYAMVPGLKFIVLGSAMNFYGDPCMLITPIK